MRKKLLVLSTLLFVIPLADAMAAAVTPPACPLNLGTSTLFSNVGAASRTGAASTFTVPANVTTIRIIAVGADGGIETSTAGTTSGVGASIEANFTVTPGQIVTVIPGLAGSTGDFESGGGGASGAYLTAALSVVAGGGGGDDNTGNGGGGTATNDGSNSGSPAGQDCNLGGLGGIAGTGGQFGELPDAAQTIACQTGDGGAGGGGFLSAGGTSDDVAAIAPAHAGPSGGARCNIAGALGGVAGLRDPSAGDGAGADGGFGICGGGGADHREAGGGGGYSGGGGGPEGQFPGGGGSFLSAAAANTSLTAGTSGGGSGRNGAVRICYGLADLRVTKTDGVGTVASGAATSYTINVTNTGPNSADGATFQDAAATGLTCNTPSVCTASGGAQCPGGAVNGVVNVTLASIQAGVVIPTLPNGGNLSFALVCTITATGF
jgi:uncharacterized repeat protein (TIGR01451 family)